MNICVHGAHALACWLCEWPARQAEALCSREPVFLASFSRRALFVLTRATYAAMLVLSGWVGLLSLSLVWAPFCSGKSNTKSCSVAYRLVSSALCRVLADERSHVTVDGTLSLSHSCWA
jgi:hypothetical protein